MVRNANSIARSLTTLVIAFSLVAGPVYGQLVERKKLDLGVKEVKREKSNAGDRKNKLNRSAAFIIEVKKDLIKKIGKTIAYYKKMVRRLEKGPGELSIMMRLLDLHIEQAAYVRNEEERSYDARWTRWDLNGRKGREPNLDDRKSRNLWKGVIAQSDQIQRTYPRNKRADRVIFSKAFAYSYIGREKESAQVYTQLIQKYPNSSVAGDAYSSLGDYYFERNDFRNALNKYRAVLKYKNSRQYVWALFKLGWCYYNLGNNTSALRYWKEVVKIGRRGGGPAVNLADQALRDMVFAFAALKDVQGAIRYYRANKGSKYIGGLLTLLAQELADDGQFNEAIKTFKLYQKELPTDPAAPEAQKELVLLLYEIGKAKLLWQELGTLHRLYGVEGRWSRANKRPVVVETRVMVKKQVLYYAKILHDRAQKGNDAGLYNWAKKGYLDFLKYYPRSREVSEVNFLIADIDFQLKNYRESGKRHLQIVVGGKAKAVRYDPDTGKPGQNIHKQSALYMVDSFARDFEVEFKALQKRKPDYSKANTKARPLSPRARNYIRACTTYLKYYPKDRKMTETCETDLAKIYYRSNDKKKARTWLFLVATKYPNKKDIGPPAVESLVPLYKGDDSQLLSIADRLLKIPAYQRGKIGEKLRGLKRSVAKKAVESEKKPLVRAKKYEALAKQNPKDPEADKLLYKAADNYLTAGEPAAAIGANLYLIKRYPKSPLAEKSLADVAQLYEKQLNFPLAASYYQRYATAYPKSNKAQPALAKSCYLQIAVDSPKASQICLAYARRVKNEAPGIINSLIVSAERSKRYSEMSSLINNNYLKLRLSSNAKIVALYRIYRVAGGRGAAAQRAAGQMLAEARRGGQGVSGEASRYVGEILFKKANAGLAGYFALKLVGGDEARLQKSILAKNAALQKMVASYKSVIEFGDAYSNVPAYHQMGIMHEQFAQLLSKPPAIKGATQEQLKEILKGQVAELEKQAALFYKEGYKVVRDKSVYSEWSVRTVSAFYRVTGSSLSFDDYVVSPDFIGSEVTTTLINGVKK